MPIFRSKRDIEFVKRINRELIEHVVGEKIVYYPVSLQYSETNFYGESSKKVVDAPVEMYALVEWKDQDVTTTDAGQDITYSIDVFILDDYLQRLEVLPREGDFIDFDNIKFEIMSITEPKLILGRAGENLGRAITCKSVREGTFTIAVSGTVEHAERTHIDNPQAKYVNYSEINYPYSGSV